MKYILLFLLLLSTTLSAQNKALIRNTFYKQTINNIDKIAIENGYRPDDFLFFNASFKADTQGEIFDVAVSSTTAIFNEEIVSMIKQIPHLDPEEYIKKGDTMRYELKITLRLASRKERKKIRKTNNEVKIKYTSLYIKEFFPLNTITIATSTIKGKFKYEVSTPPIPIPCKHLSDFHEIKRCVAQEITTHVNSNFDADLISNLPKGKYRINTKFHVSKNGIISNITAEADFPELEEEAIRAINSYPNFYKGGIYDGKPVDVPYALPIIIAIE